MLEAERLWRHFHVRRKFIRRFDCPKSARSRKAVATRNPKLKIRAQILVRKVLEAERLWRLKGDVLVKLPVLQSEKCSKPKGCGDLEGEILVKPPVLRPKRARSRKAVATQGTRILYPERIRLSEKCSKPKGCGDFWNCRTTSGTPYLVRKGLDAERLMFSENKRCIYCNP